MFEVLRKYFENRFSFTEDQFEFIKSAFIPRTIKKGNFIQRGGEVARFAVFVERGCLRMYIIDDKSREHVVQFAPETWWLHDSDSLIRQQPSKYFIDALEDTDVLLLHPASHQKLIDNIPGYASSFQAGIQKHLAAKNERIVNALSSSAEERYNTFLETYPSIALRVPQHMIASYLGISPETLSRVRKRISRK